MAWEIKKLNKVGNIFSGNSINAKVKNEKFLNIDSGMPYVATKDVSYDSVIDYDNGVKIPENELSNFRVAHKDSILICAEGGSAGRKLAFNTKDICFVNKLFALEPFDFMEPRYIFYFYHTSEFQEQFKSRMTGLIGGVSMGKFKEIKIPVPPLPIQKKIVAILDEAFEKIAKAKENSEQNLKNAKEVFESYLQKVFENKGEDWEEKRFDEICVLQRGFDLPTKERRKGNFPLVSSNGITDHIDIFKVKAPGVVTGRSGTIGAVHFIENDFWPLNTALYIKNFHGNDEKFIYYFLRFFNLNKYSSGAGVPTLNRNNVHCEKTHFLNLKSKQINLANKMDKILFMTNNLLPIYNKKLSYLEELKQSILQKAFKGELTEVSV